MNNWDELEKAAREADGAVARNINTATEKWQHFRLIAKPDVVLSLIEQNRELLEALHDIYNEVDGNIEPTVRDLVNQCGRNTPTDPNEIYEYCASIKAVVVEAIRKATGEEA